MWLSDIDSAPYAVRAGYFRIYVQPIRITQVPASKLSANWRRKPLCHHVITLHFSKTTADWISMIVFVGKWLESKFVRKHSSFCLVCVSFTLYWISFTFFSWHGSNIFIVLCVTFCRVNIRIYFSLLCS